MAADPNNMGTVCAHSCKPQTGPVTRAILAMRSAAARDRLSRLVKPDPQVKLRETLLRAYEEAQAVRPIFEEDIPSDSPRYRAAFRVDMHMRELVEDVLKAPAPRCAEGLKLVALAAAIHAEGLASGTGWDNSREMVAAARALLLATGTALPPSFLGFGDEPDYSAHEAAMLARKPRLPARLEIAAKA